MPFARWGIGMGLAAALTAASCSRDPAAVPAAEGIAPPAEVASPAEAGAPRYPENPSGLEDLLMDLGSAERDGNREVADRLLYSLRLEDARAFFEATFPAPLAEALADGYRPYSEDIGVLGRVLAEKRGQGLTDFRVERFAAAGNPDSTGYQSAALAAMEAPTPLYSVRLISPTGGRVFHIWSFAHVGDTFRYLGKMKAVARAELASGRDLLEYRLGDAEKIARAPRR